MSITTKTAEFTVEMSQVELAKALAFHRPVHAIGHGRIDWASLPIGDTRIATTDGHVVTFEHVGCGGGSFYWDLEG